MSAEVKFSQRGACSNDEFDPDWWFPQEKAGKSNWSRTPDANKARAICAHCPILQECREYALQYEGIYGIWGGWDWHEMRAERKRRNIIPESWAMTYVSLYRDWSLAPHGQE
jgi:WhiB family redox-sensing transcriptional regulator